MNRNGTVKALAAVAAVGAMFAAPHAWAGDKEDAAKPAGVLVLPFGDSPVLSYSWGAVQSGSIGGGGGGGGAGKVSIQDFHITRPADAHSPKIFKAVATGEHLAIVEINSGATKFKLQDVLISSYQTGGSGADGKVTRTDQVSFNFGKITYTVDGSSTCLDIVQNKAC